MPPELVLQNLLSASFLAAVLRVTTPILLPALGALVTERAGVLNIGLEGMMLAAAFTGAVTSAYTTAWVGLCAGIAAATALALLLGYCHLELGADLFLAGIAINILGAAGTAAFMFALTGDKGNTSSIATLQMPLMVLPTFIQTVPLIGTTLDKQNIMTWVAFLAVPATAYMLYHTPFGAHLRATGENPHAATAAGIRTKCVKYRALALSGLFAGFGGVYLSMGYLGMFQRDMTAGRGYIALVAPLLGRGTPGGTLLAALTFGFFDALGVRLGSLAVPPPLVQMLPYLAAVLALVSYALWQRIGHTTTPQSHIRKVFSVGGIITGVVLVLLAVCLFAVPAGFGFANPHRLGIALLSTGVLGIAASVTLLSIWQQPQATQ